MEALSVLVNYLWDAFVGLSCSLGDASKRPLYPSDITVWAGLFLALPLYFRSSRTKYWLDRHKEYRGRKDAEAAGFVFGPDQPIVEKIIRRVAGLIVLFGFSLVLLAGLKVFIAFFSVGDFLATALPVSVTIFLIVFFPLRSVAYDWAERAIETELRMQHVVATTEILMTLMFLVGAGLLIFYFPFSRAMASCPG